MRRLGLLTDADKQKSAVQLLNAVDVDGNGKVRARHAGCCAGEQRAWRVVGFLRI